MHLPRNMHTIRKFFDIRNGIGIQKTLAMNIMIKRMLNSSKPDRRNRLIKRPGKRLPYAIPFKISKIYRTQNTLCTGPVSTNLATACPGVLGQAWLQRKVTACAGTARYVHVAKPKAVVGVSGAFIAKHPAAVQSLVDGLVRAGDLLTRDPDKAAPAVAANLAKGIVNLEIIKTALKSPATKFVIDPREVIAPSKAMEAYQVKLGSLKEAAPLDDLFDVRFYEKARRPG